MAPGATPGRQRSAEQLYNLVSWNVDYSSPSPGERISKILSHILSLSPAIDIIFLQEVTSEAFSVLLKEPAVRRGWLLSDTDSLPPTGQSFTTITLLSRTSFQTPNPGPVWRVQYPSRFQRDALCCDIFAYSAVFDSPRPHRLRLVNVHLDSLPIQPSLRPRQVSIVAGLLRSAGRGIIAGDFNPVLPSDNALLQENGLTDAWVELRPGEPGITCGMDGKEPFPPNRMDKVAALGVRVRDIDILLPGHIGGGMLAWSDHSGLRCSFTLVGT